MIPCQRNVVSDRLSQLLIALAKAPECFNFIFCKGPLGRRQADKQCLKFSLGVAGTIQDFPSRGPRRRL